ncbi:glutamate--tRNA ligase [Enterobacteriaceae endosymbiont of Macroplea mutica]|uniref:glutamate--tRNA ligase n=1 Tax=Enterobacteriaceae endosymbiont of Macroplea mutica TaxID=2675791 RepID=UPI0014490193|nr:glutamate--tRNA ligase [Enterobacteriaceae endosymbiont of Macroplea mutica]QJC31064.1 glutamate--tRNA ligase [Enterobacteriaceae endosymbiont of Macroplea mutica]
MKIRTRFAPSPSGYLHIGNIRTALYSWLFAKKNHGNFILRIEDTDKIKVKEHYIQNIISSLTWLNINWDEGPYLQSENLDKYHSIINNMIQQGIAYKCYCTKQILKKDKEQQKKLGMKTKYNGRCRNINKTYDHIPYVVRFRTPTTGYVKFKDIIRGNIIINNIELDDFIIQRTDKTPTYNFCVAIDDLDMCITHVIRGEEHINNTPKQINIIKSLKRTIPYYAHVSIITNQYGEKISKKNHDTNILQYKKDGYLPQALLNYILKLGWSYGDQEIFSMSEMKKLFCLSNLNKSPSIFNINKLNWFNKYYLNHLSKDYIVPYLSNFCKNKHFNINTGPKIIDIYHHFVNRCNTLKEINNLCCIFYTNPNYQNVLCANLINIKNKKFITQLLIIIQSINPWTINNINLIIKTTAQQLDKKFADIAMTLRILLTGLNYSPPINSIIYLMGKNKVIQHIQNVINMINKQNK